jgi:NAD-dependent deacetylase
MLHTRAGSREVFEVHGHLSDATCVECYRVVPVDQLNDQVIETGEVLYCSSCGGVLKPNVILFGEQLPIRVLHASQRAARECDLMLVAGSSLTVAPAADLPQIALAHGAKLIVINYDPTYIDQQADVVIHADVAEILPHLAKVLEVS